MRPKDVVSAWVDAFNRGDAEMVAPLYHEDAVNHQVVDAPVEGREAIRAMFAREFARAKMTCIVENLFEDGEWAILEWRDPLGLRGCGFFQIRNGKIAFQRGYWDKLSFLKLHGLAAEGIQADEDESGKARADGPQPIVDAWVEHDHLVLLSPLFDRLAVPLMELAEFIGTDRAEIEAFDIDEDGLFLYWPHADVHLGWEQLLQIVDPATAVAAKHRSREFNERYGAAIRSLREEQGLKQSDIEGLTERHLRRVEHGEQAASKATLELLASTHDLALDEYLGKLAKRMGIGS